MDKLRESLLPDADQLGLDIGERIRIGIEEKLGDIHLDVLADTEEAVAGLDEIKAKADEVGAKAETIEVKADTAPASVDLDKIRADADEVGAKKETIKVNVDNASGVRGWLTSLIAGAVAIAPAFAVAGVGIGAFALLAAPALSGIVKYESAVSSGSAKAAADYAKLTDAQKEMVTGLRGVETEFKTLDNSLSPEILKVFDAALSQIQQILPEIVPVAKAGGTALANMINIVGSAFTGSQGRQFFEFVQHNLGPDVSAISQLAVQLIHTLFNLVEALQPVSLGLIHIVSDLAGFISWLSKASPVLTGIIVLAIALYKPLKALAELNLVSNLTSALSTIKYFLVAEGDVTVAMKAQALVMVAMDALNPWGWVALGVIALAGLVVVIHDSKTGLDMLTASLRQQYNANGYNVQGLSSYANALKGTTLTTNQLVQATGALGRGKNAVGGYGNAVKDLAPAQIAASNSVNTLRGNLGVLERTFGLNQAGAIRFAQAAGVSAQSLEGNGKASQAAWVKLNAYGAAENSTTGMTNTLTIAVNDLTAAMAKNVTQVLTLQGDDISWRQAQEAATKQLASNTAGLAGNSANALANKAAVLASTNQVVTFASDQLTLHGNMKLASSEILNQIRYLQQHGDKSKFAAAEIAALRGEEAKIKAQIKSQIDVSGSGKWSVTGGNVGPVLPGGHRIQQAAGGMLITTGRRGVDDQLILAQRGEAIVPPHLVPPIAPYLAAHGVQGFAEGGVVGSFSGSVPGLEKWTQQQYAATVHAVQAATAAAVTGALSAASAGGVSPMPGGGSDAANAALARKMMPAWSAGLEWADWNNVAMRESGWNSFAANPTSDARGIAQNISGWGPNYEPGNAGQQIAWMINYISGRYGSPVGAWAHEVNFGWYDDGGYAMPGATMLLNGTGRPEPVLSPGQMDSINAAADGMDGGRTVNYNANFLMDSAQFESRVMSSFRMMDMKSSFRERAGRKS